MFFKKKPNTITLRVRITVYHAFICKTIYLGSCQCNHNWD